MPVSCLSFPFFIVTEDHQDRERSPTFSPISRRKFLAGAVAVGTATATRGFAMNPSSPDLILVNGKFSTLDRANPQADAVAIQDGRFVAVGTRDEIMKLARPGPR